MLLSLNFQIQLFHQVLIHEFLSSQRILNFLTWPLTSIDIPNDLLNIDPIVGADHADLSVALFGRVVISLNKPELGFIPSEFIILLEGIELRVSGRVPIV